MIKYYFVGNRKDAVAVRGCLHGGRKILEGGTTFCWVYMQRFWSVRFSSTVNLYASSSEGLISENSESFNVQVNPGDNTAVTVMKLFSDLEEGDNLGLDNLEILRDLLKGVKEWSLVDEVDKFERQRKDFNTLFIYFLFGHKSLSYFFGKKQSATRTHSNGFIFNWQWLFTPPHFTLDHDVTILDH